MDGADTRAEVLAQKERIEKLKARAEALSKGNFFSVECDGVPLKVQEEYWKRLVAVEEAGTTTLAKVLEETGFELTPPDRLNDEQLAEKLRVLIRRMADFRCFLERTNHLSDRELYTHLLEVTLREEMNATVAEPDPATAWHIDLLHEECEEDLQIILKYYADEMDREDWQMECPDIEMPPMSIPPYDRDERLPKWDESAD